MSNYILLCFFQLGNEGGACKVKIPVGRAKSNQTKPLWQEVLETLLSASILALLCITFIARAFTVDGPSMLPTLADGERLLIDQVTYRFRPPRRGEIVVFRYPASPDHYFVKRIIGIPGDVVAIENGCLVVNGQPIDEPYIAERMWGQLPPTEVPADAYFVLGDNRNNSKDSRSADVGFVPQDLIVGRAIWRYWPLNKMSILTTPEAAFAALK